MDVIRDPDSAHDGADRGSLWPTEPAGEPDTRHPVSTEAPSPGVVLTAMVHPGGAQAGNGDPRGNPYEAIGCKYPGPKLLLDLDDLDRAAAEPDDYVYGHMEPGQVALLLGEPGIGKSTLGLHIAVSVATGAEFGGIKPATAQPVFLLCPEDSTRIVGRRVRAAATAMRADKELLRHNLRIVNCERPFTMFKKDGDSQQMTEEGDELIRHIKGQGARLVIFDPLVEMHMASENDNGQMHWVFGMMRRIATEAKCAILIAHHVNKDSTGKVVPASSRGAGSIIASVRLIQTVSKLDKDEVAAFRRKDIDANDMFKLDSGKVSYHRRNSVAVYFQRIDVDLGAYKAPALRQVTI